MSYAGKSKVILIIIRLINIRLLKNLLTFVKNEKILGTWKH